MEEQIKILLNNKLNYLNGLLADAIRIGDLENITIIETQINEINILLNKLN